MSDETEVVTTRRACSDGVHNYTPTGEKFRRNQGEDVLVYATFYCTKCCDVQERKVAVWPGAANKKNKKAYGPDPSF